MILPKAELTPSGRPKLVPGEVERVLLDKVDIEFEESGCTEGCAPEKVYKSGYAVVTSHRLLWIDAAATPGPGRSCHLPLDTIHSVQKRVQYTINLINPKVRLEVKVFVDRHFKVTPIHSSATFKYFALRCRGETPDSFQEHLSAAMAAHKTHQEQQQAKQRQQQQQQSQSAFQQPHSNSQQQQQQSWAANSSSGPLSHPISGALATGSYDGYDGPLPPGMWLDTSSQQQQQQQQQHASSGGGSGLPPRSPAAGRGLQAVDGELLGQLVDMGFSRQRVVRSLLATNNETLQAALDWILAYGSDPNMDAPLPVPEPAVVTRPELQRLHQLNMLQQGPAAVAAATAGQQQQYGSGFRPQEQLNPGWGMGSVSAAAALGGAGAGQNTGGSGGGGGYGYPGGSWSAVGPLTAGMPGGPGSGGGGAGSSSGSPRKGGSSPLGQGGLAAGAAGGPSSSSRLVGVAGIMNREAEKNSQTAAHLAVAFQDLDALMGMAAEMVKLAEKFRGVMGPDGAITLSPSSHSSSSSSLSSLHAAAAGGSSGSLLGTAEGANAAVGGAGAGPSSGEQLLLDSETQLQLIAMGITSPVTRASAGVRFQQELARQLADFLAAPLAKAGGVMMLPDVYCLFNRARGAELVSPDDLMQACDAFPQVGLPLRLRRFPSGVLVVQGSQFSDTQLCRSIEQLLQRKSQAGPPTTQPSPSAAADAAADLFPGGVTTPTISVTSSSSSYVAGLGPALSAADVSAALLLPLTLAKEALLVAESSGVLCRDDGPEGLRFFRNFFREAQPVVF